MAKVTIDESLCTGCGLCAANCPEAFEIGGDNIARVTKDTCPTCDFKEIADQCPLSAIIVK